MLSEDRVKKLENIVQNYTALMMASMSQIVGNAMTPAIKTVANAFDTPLETSDGKPVEDISEYIKNNVPGETLKMFDDTEMEVDEEQRKKMIKEMTNESVDQLIKITEQVDCVLPKFHKKLSPELLFGYFCLLEKREKQITDMFTGITDFLQEVGRSVDV